MPGCSRRGLEAGQVIAEWKSHFFKDVTERQLDQAYEGTRAFVMRQMPLSLRCFSETVTCLCSIIPATDPADPLRARVLPGIFLPLHQTFPSLLLNPAIGTSVLTVVGYPQAGLPMSEKSGQSLALEYSSQLCLQVLQVGRRGRGIVSRTSSLFLPSAQHRPTPISHVFVTPFTPAPCC